MRLDQIKFEQTATLHVRMPNGAPAYNADGSPTTIELLSGDDERLRAYDRQAQNRRLKNISKLRLSAEELEEEAILKLANATAGWNSFENEDGPIPCTIENAAKLYREHHFLFEQVDQFVGDRTNFLQTSATG
jgi:hypothetical protein